jgi:hypothetical protein
MRDSIVFYRSFYEAIQDLPSEQQAQAYNAIFAYSLDETEPKLSGVVSTVFKLIKPQLDANQKRYTNGNKGGRPKNQTQTEPKPNHNQTITETEPNVNVNVNVNDNVNENGNGNVLLAAPPKEQVIDYFADAKMSKEQALAFYNYYDSANWMRNKTKITNWKSAADFWISKADQPVKQRQMFNPNQYE